MTKEELNERIKERFGENREELAQQQLQKQKEERKDAYEYQNDISTRIIQERINHINRINKEIRITNIGINAGNIVRQIYGYYNRQGVSIDESVIIPIVKSYISSKTELAIQDLNDYIDEFEPDNLVTNPFKAINLVVGPKIKKEVYKEAYKVKRQLTTKIPTENSKYLDAYKQKQEELFYFDFQRDIVSLIDNYLDTYCIKDEWYKNDVNEWIDTYNDELKQLGINEKVEYRYFDKNGEEYKRVKK